MNNPVLALSRRSFLGTGAAAIGAMAGLKLSTQTQPLQRSVDTDARQRLVDALTDPTGEGQALLGYELVDQLRDIIAVQALTYRALWHRPLAQGEMNKTKVTGTFAFYATEDPDVIQSREAWKSRVIPREYRNIAFPVLLSSELSAPDLPQLLARAMDAAKCDLITGHDARLIKLFEAAVQFTGQVVVGPLSSTLRKATELAAESTKDESRTASVFLNSDDFRTRTRGAQPSRFLRGARDVAFYTSAESLDVVPPKVAYVTCAPKLLGDIATRVELFSEPWCQLGSESWCPEGGQPRRGWAFSTIQSMCIGNPYGVVKIISA